MQFKPWWWEAAPRPPSNPKDLPAEVDVAIIGAGYTGLSAALTLARAGRGVALLEAGPSGFGASTRNGGQVGSGNQKFTVQTLIDQFGRERAAALLREGTAMLEYIAELIEVEQIDCDFARVGRFRGAVRPAHYEAMARDMADLQRFAGVEFEMVPKAQQHREILTEAYHGGGLLPHDAALHPGLFHQGLADRVDAAGAQLIDHTKVLDVQPEGSGFLLRTERGALRAGEVVVASNGYTGRQLPALHARTVTVGSSIIASEALDPELLASLLPGGRVYGNTARVFNYYRASPDGRRLLFGGRSQPLARADNGHAYRHLYRDMLAVFPALDGVAISHAWRGQLGFTRDGFPHLGQRDGLWYALGYCGTGVSRAVWFGRKVALKLLGDAEGRSAFDGLDFSPFYQRWAAPLGVAAATAWHRLRDNLGN